MACHNAGISREDDLLKYWGGGRSLGADRDTEVVLTSRSSRIQKRPQTQKPILVPIRPLSKNTSFACNERDVCSVPSSSTRRPPPNYTYVSREQRMVLKRARTATQDATNMSLLCVDCRISRVSFPTMFPTSFLQSNADTVAADL